MADKENLIDVGVAQIDITPDYPIRLNGYGSRRTESEGIIQRIYAKALVIGSDDDDPVVMITVENCGLPDELTEEVSERVKNKTGISRENFVACYTHTHSAPCLTNAASFIFSADISPEEQEKIDRYTQQLKNWMETVALEALTRRQPCRLAWNIGELGFAKNRRTEGGPVDHSLPVMQITDADGTLRAVWVSYACHCTTLAGADNHICGDWAGFAQEEIQNAHPDVTALITIGCGADANPESRMRPMPEGKQEVFETRLAYAKEHGRALAQEVEHQLEREAISISNVPKGAFARVNLPFDKLPTHEEWEERAAQGGAGAYHAKKHLEMLQNGQAIKTDISYPIQAWTFGDELAVLFLASEVVVDFSLRLKKEFDTTRLWVGAYANAFPGYIPSERVLAEGGYEGGGAMIYFGQPTRFAPGVEQLVIDTVHQVLPTEFLAKSNN
ncbi:MAG: neutral/alkaline non-lysosomal ceramidase N-terminal domain-containing protein [Candidatus Poribacteria bacterium]|nr:neutral/alkaline non-lysosomal ceramidase N-terminal domain-containing protein [Candidatus Poribacteria bacterium]